MIAQLVWLGQKLFGTRFLPLTQVDGLPLPPIQLSLTSWQKQIDDLRGMDLRHDDVILCAYPKAGTHWLWEIVSMLLAGQAHYEPRSKELLMMDVTPLHKLHHLHAPRVLNTHLPFSMLPVCSARARRVKIVHVYRNPRDVMVSMFYHLRQFKLAHTDTLQNFCKAFLAGDVTYGRYASYLNQMDKFIRDNPDLSIFNLSYEDIKRDPQKTVGRLAAYLEVEASEALISDIVEACNFQNMRKVDETKEHVRFLGMELQQKLYRKGEVGDWQNHLTNEEVTAFDTEFNTVLATDRFPFIYSL